MVAQTTDGLSMTNVQLEMSDDGTDYTDISGFANSVEWDGGERDTDAVATFKGDTMIVTAGKRNPITVTAKVVYTEGMTDPTELVNAALAAGTPLYLRWSPKGGGVGSNQYSTTEGVVKKPALPGGAADDAAAILVEIVVECADVTKAVVAA